MSKLKIAHTVWPNGHKCIWFKCDVDTMFDKDKYGNIWFAWSRLFKEKLKKEE